MLVGDDTEVGALVARGTDALVSGGDLWAGGEWFDMAFRAAERAGDATAMAESVLGIGGLWVHDRSAAGTAVLLARLRQVLGLVEPCSPIELRLRARLAAETDYRSGGYAAIAAVLDEAERSGDATSRATALGLAHHCLSGPDHGYTRRAIAAGLIAESSRTGQRADLLLGLLWQCVDLLLEGDRHAGRRLNELREELNRADHIAIGQAVRGLSGMLAVRSGTLDADTVDAAWYRGGLAELLPALRTPADDAGLAAQSTAAALAGKVAEAASALARLRDLPRTGGWLVTMHFVVETACLLEDVETAESAYEQLLPYATLPMMSPLADACYGSTRHALGVAALTAGRLDDAVEQLRLAVDANLALGHWPALAHSRMRYAQALHRRGSAADRAAAARQRAAAGTEASTFNIPVPEYGGGRADRTTVATCVRQDQRWRIDYGHRTVRVPHRVGLLHLAVLLANPGRDIPSLELVAGVAALGAAMPAPAAQTGQPILDRVAVREYRDRIRLLDEQIDGYEASGATDRAEATRAEREWLLAELSAGTAIHGRARTFNDNPERARLAVARSIRRALATIEEVDDHIGEHLRDSIHTGVRCSYRPDAA